MQLTNTTVVFDLDDTLADLRNPLQKILTAYSGVSCSWTEWKTFYTPQYYSITEKEFLDVIVDSKLLEYLEPHEETERTLTKIKDNGYDIAVITSRAYHPEALKITKKWFDKYGLPVDEIHVSSHGVNKLDYVKHRDNILMFVDDRIENCENVINSGRSEYTYLYTQPWNASSNLDRISTLIDLHKHL